MLKDGRLRCYLSGVAGFVVSFGAIVSPFAYFYSVHADVFNKQINSAPMMAMATIPHEVSVIPPVVATAKVSEIESAKTSAKLANIASEAVEANIKESVAAVPDKVSNLDLVGTEINSRTSAYREQPISYKTIPANVLHMDATAYCLNSVTASGVTSKYGIVAADPRVLPIGSIVKVFAGEYTGLYTVMDTGGSIKGNIIDIYLTNHQEAVKFGRRKIGIEVLRFGWNPQAANMQATAPLVESQTSKDAKENKDKEPKEVIETKQPKEDDTEAEKKD